MEGVRERAPLLEGGRKEGGGKKREEKGEEEGRQWGNRVKKKRKRNVLKEVPKVFSCWERLAEGASCLLPCLLSLSRSLS